MSERELWRAIKELRNELDQLRALSRLTYAKSTFTPTYLGATTAGVTTYTTQVGAYVRTGAKVTCTGRLVWTAATGTGVAVIGGLPFTSRNTTNLRYPVTLWVSAVTFGGSFVEALLAENATAFTLYTTTTNAAATQLNVEAAGDIAFQVTYFI